MSPVKRRTVANNEEVDSKNCKPLSDTVIRVLEAPLHDGSVDFNQDDARQSGD
jgi:hypothetical protein